MNNNKTAKKERYCFFCVSREIAIDYKNTEVLKRFMSSFGKIVARKRSGLCSSHQRKVANEMKISRIIGLMPFVQK
ncbi:MAG: 30S ribosomal protein S18 [Candidatus Uhrbacteria bacterium]|nr:30S ribosomal protein S18 [Candidatus Uhrbacteria bacterium]